MNRELRERLKTNKKELFGGYKEQETGVCSPISFKFLWLIFSTTGKDTVLLQAVGCWNHTATCWQEIVLVELLLKCISVSSHNKSRAKHAAEQA